jgi:DNA polymerase-3 subunit beta
MKATLYNDKVMLAAKLANVPRKSTLPLLQCVKVEAAGNNLILTGTDLDTTTRITIPALVEEEGAVLLPFDRVRKIVESAKKNDLAVFAGDSLKIGRAGAKLPTFDLEDYPQIYDIPDEIAGVTFPNIPEAMRQLGNASKALSNDQSRKILTTVSIDGENRVARFVATDSYRMYVGSPIGMFRGDAKIELSRDAVEIVLKAGKSLKGLEISRHVTYKTDTLDLVTMQLEDGMVCEIFSRSVEGSYPNWRQIMFDNPACSCTFDRSQLSDGAKFLKKMRSGNQPMIIDGTAKRIELREYDNSFSYDVEAWDCDDESERAFSVEYVIDALATSKEKTIRVLSLASNLRPSIFENPEGDKMLIMPVRVA